MDAISGDIRIVREKVDETNVRLGSISQELESIRQAIPEPRPVAVAPPVRSLDAGGIGSPLAQPRRRPPSRHRFRRIPAYSRSGSGKARTRDYTSGNYSLAVQGFQSYLNYFPKSPQAHEAQLLHRRVALLWTRKTQKPSPPTIA